MNLKIGHLECEKLFIVTKINSFLSTKPAVLSTRNLEVGRRKK